MNNFDYIDVQSLKELPALQNADMRYIEFIGGTKNYRCYIVPRTLARVEFIVDNMEDLDELVKPIFIDNDIFIAQDAANAIPGFYVISLKKHFNYLYEINLDLAHKIMTAIYYTRKALTEILNISLVNIYYGEKNNTSSCVHFWLVPIYLDLFDKNNMPWKIENHNLREYFDLFTVSDETSNLISIYNKKLKNYFETINLTNILNKSV